MSGRKTFQVGEVLQAADVNDFLMDQSVMVFAGSAARGSAIPSPTEGMVTYRSDDDLVEVFNGSAFKPVGTILQVVSTTLTTVFTATVNAGANTAVTGLTASVTPSSASSKILVTGFISMATSDDMQYANMFLTKGGSILTAASATGVGSNRQAAHAGMAGSTGGSDRYVGSTPFHFLDSPGTTSSTTYGVNISHTRSSSQLVVVNRGPADGDTTNVARYVSTITLMEVAG